MSRSCNDGYEKCAKSVMHVQSCCFANIILLLFCRSFAAMVTRGHILSPLYLKSC